MVQRNTPKKVRRSEGYKGSKGPGEKVDWKGDVKSFISQRCIFQNWKIVHRFNLSILCETSCFDDVLDLFTVLNGLVV